MRGCSSCMGLGCNTADARHVYRNQESSAMTYGKWESIGLTLLIFNVPGLVVGFGLAWLLWG